MYIAPNTVLRILHNCPLDNTYDHTIGFASKQEQADYFSGLTKYERGQLSYQRYSTNVITVEIVADNLYDCNYLMFQNSAFGSKWFYAFITDVEYVSNNVSRITYELDVMQTWFFDWSFGQCFVDREHSVTDNVGDNTIPENLELGEYVYEAVLGTSHFRNWRAVVARTQNFTGLPVIGKTYGKSYHQVAFDTYNLDSVDDLENLREYFSKALVLTGPEQIVGFFMFPADLMYEGKTYETSAPIELPVSTTKPTTLGSYTPKNKKLLTYPYQLLHVSNGQGTGNDYHYEFWNTGSCTFNLVSGLSVKPSADLFPTYYKGMSGNNPNERISINNFPECTYAVNDFGAKVAQGIIMAGCIAAGDMMGAGQPVGSRVMEGAYQPKRLSSEKPGFSLFGGGGKRVQTGWYEPKRLAEDNSGVPGVDAMMGHLGKALAYSHVNSTVGDNSTMLNVGLFDFLFYKMHIREEYAKIVDDFFNAFGYKTNRMKYPNWNSRPHWNYVKTVNCVVHGSVPADDMKRICTIHNNGITYWKKGEEVGNYTLDNSPT